VPVSIPSFYIPPQRDHEEVNLQATLSSATAMTVDSAHQGVRGLHHPITCGNGALALDEDGSMRCEHATALAECTRNQDCINATIAILLFELVHQKYGS
jgi:hypothetical protein